MQHLTTSISFSKSLLSRALKAQQCQFGIIELVATGDYVKMLTAPSMSFLNLLPLSKSGNWGPDATAVSVVPSNTKQQDAKGGNSERVQWLCVEEWTTCGQNGLKEILYHSLFLLKTHTHTHILGSPQIMR